MFERDGEATARSVADECHITLRNAREYLNILHSNEEIHVARLGPYNVPVYGIGKSKDAKRLNSSKRTAIRRHEEREKSRSIRAEIEALNIMSQMSITAAVLLGAQRASA